MVKPGKELSTAMNARIIGSGEEAIILAYGYGGDQSVWDNLVPHLSRHYRVLVFDWSFSGAIKDPTLFDPAKYSSLSSFADDLISLVEEMNFSPSVFVGHSMSGMIGCIASIKRPDLFNTLVLIAASPRYINTEDYEGGFEKSDVDQILSDIESDFPNWASNLASLSVGVNDTVSADKLGKCLKRMRPETALSVAKLVFHSDERATLEKVTCPCTIIQTAHDTTVPRSVVDYMQKQIKGKATVEYIDTVGHVPHLTAPVQLLDVLRRVLGFHDV